MDRLIGANAVDEVGGVIGNRAAVAEIAGVAHHVDAEGEEILRPHLDHQHIHQQQDPILILLRDLRHTTPGFRAAEAVRHWRDRIGVLAEQRIAHGEPHIVVTADAFGFRAALVLAMRFKQAFVEMAEAGFAQMSSTTIFWKSGATACASIAPRASTMPVMVRRVPQRLAIASVEQEFLLFGCRVRPALQKPRGCVDDRSRRVR